MEFKPYNEMVYIFSYIDEKFAILWTQNIHDYQAVQPQSFSLLRMWEIGW